MRQVISFMLCALLVGLGGSFVYADRDTSGSSTDSSLLQGANTGRSTYTNVHSGVQVVAANKVAATDASVDSHPFETTRGRGH